MRTLFITISILLFFQFNVKAQGCMGGGDEGVNVKGFIQPQFENYFLGEDGLGESLNQNSFTFNRARIGFVGTIPYDFSYYFFTELSPFKNNTPKLLDAFITYSRFAPYAKFSIGQFKSPFSLELNTACHKLHTINRSEVVTQLASPMRDLGFMVYGGADSTFWKYKIAIMNGTGMGLLDDNRTKDVIGRFTVNPFVNNDNMDLNIGGGFKLGKVSTDQGDKDDIVKNFAADIEFKFNNLLIQGEYIMGSYEGQNTIIQPIYGGCGSVIGYDTLKPGTYNKGGFWVQAMYMTPWNIQPIIKYEMYDPDVDVAVSDYNSVADLNNDPDVSMDYLKNSLKRNIITFGINYFFNDWTRLQINYLYRMEESSSTDSYLYFEEANDAVIIQLQVQF